MDTLHSRIKIARRSRRISQQRMAEHFHVDKTTICRWEEKATPKIEQIAAIADYLNAPRMWLTFGGEPPAFVRRFLEKSGEARQ